MSRLTGVLLALLVGAMFLPEDAVAQRRPSNNMWTRSAKLYLDRARTNPRPEEKRALYQQALEAALEGIENDPSNPQIYLIAGQAYVRLGEYYRADTMFTKATAMYPDYEKEVNQERNNGWVQAYNLGINMLQQGNIEDAIAQFEKADAIYKGRPDARLQLGAAYARKNDLEKAIEAYRGALEILRGPAREKVPPQQRAQWAEQEEIAAFNMAQMLASLGRDEEAAQAYRDFLAREPNNTTAKINLAVVLSRQEKDEEASKLYAELLADQNLGAGEYQLIGVGLFRSKLYDQARDAFRKALERNPYMRDAKYNLAQALNAQSTELEEKRQAASGAEAASYAEQLKQLYDELAKVSEEVVQMDPYNRNARLLLVRGYRGLADVDDAGAEQWRNKALEVLRAQEAMEFEVDGIRMTGQDKQAQVQGQFRNLKLEAGQPVKIVFTFLGEGGTTVATKEVQVVTPPAESASSFQLDVEASGTILGWKYDVSR